MEKSLAIRYAEAVDQIDAHRQTISTLNEKIVGLESVLADNELLQAKVTELEAAIVSNSDSHTVAIADKVSQIEAIETEKAAIAAELETVKGKLAMSPAHIDVAGRGAIKDESEGGETLTRDDLWSNYAKLSDPAAKAAYFKAHRTEMEKK